MALYLKYRPQSFADVVGQDHIVGMLEQAVARDLVTHAYLFAGTRGTGKTSVARILAKALLVRGIADPTVQSHILRGVEDGSLVDLIEIDAASTRGIDDIRDLIEKIQFSPVVSGAKVYIIDEVHMLTKEAFNALLKTLEEPPTYAFFILATTELHKVPETIQSRCQRFPFRRVKEEDIVRRLQFIADQERITVDRTALRIIARHATGSFRDAISLLDQLKSLDTITPEDVRDRIGETDQMVVDELLDAIGAKKRADIPAIIERVEEAGFPLDTIVRTLLTVVRERMHEAISKGESTAPYTSIVDTLLRALKDLRVSPVPGLVLEGALLSLIDQADGITEKTMNFTPRKDVAPRGEESSPKKVEKVITEKKRALIEAEDVTAENVRKHWNVLLSQVVSPSVRMSLKNGIVHDIHDDTVRIAFASAFHRDKVAATDASRAVEDILKTIFKRPLRIECMLEENAHGHAGDDASTDLVEAAKEVFGSAG
jgi:DNA polymerase-3 subunit gamma/tau